MTVESGNNKKRKEKEEKKVVLKGILKDKVVLVPSSEDIEGLTSRGYGTPENNNLALRHYEALYLVDKGIMEVIDEETGTQIGFQQLLTKARIVDKDAWVRYLIYHDLRSRGYVVREGFGLGIDFRVYKRGEYSKSTAEYLVLGIKEGQPVTVMDLAGILSRAQSLKKTLILSVLNRRGEIVYYSLSQLSFKKEA
ncbi:tRNA-intron lyase [Candidatus Bathyarchaeota archaeon]|nr:tRNA-intron lyase [Candidatus Bathyarchaeota archaeon]